MEKLHGTAPSKIFFSAHGGVKEPEGEERQQRQQRGSWVKVLGR